MIQFNVYPGGLKRIVTFSFDDGSQNDARLISLLNKYGLKSTFHLNGMNYIGKSDEELGRIRTLYGNHEIACHTFSHGWPSEMPVSSLIGEIMKDRKILERIAGYPVTGMSYQSGSYNGAVAEVMKMCGIDYSRTVRATSDFGIPDDFLAWHPTCHFKNAVPHIERFLDGIDSQWSKPLLYIWGHSHEIRSEQEWENTENMLRMISGNSKILYAANIDIFNYVSAQKMLKISADEKIFHNPSATDVWVEKDKKRIIKIPAGSRVVLE